jgi:hypothetical protein
MACHNCRQLQILGMRHRGHSPDPWHYSKLPPSHTCQGSECAFAQAASQGIITIFYDDSFVMIDKERDGDIVIEGSLSGKMYCLNNNVLFPNPSKPQACSAKTNRRSLQL